MKYKIIIALLTITLLGGFLRFYNITKNPPSLNIDEVSFGYSAYSILKTGKDEYGKFLPIIFKSTGDYKNPIPVYLMVPSIAVFGLNEFAVRFPTALVGTLSIPLIFILIKLLLKNNNYALIGAFLFSISPWHTHFSRYAYDPLAATFFLLIGVVSFIQMLNGKKYYAIVSGLAFALSMYTAFVHRLFIPLFVLTIVVLNFRKIVVNKTSLLLFLFPIFVVVLPLIYLTLFSGANTRLGMIFLINDIDYTRYVSLDHTNKFGEVLLLFFFWLKRYVNYFQPDFLFFDGLKLTSAGTLGLGVLYLFELPLLIFGVYEIISKKVPYKNIIISWLFIGLIPASLANNELSEGRALIIIPALIFILTLGLVKFISVIKSFKNVVFRNCLLITYISFVCIFLVHTFLVFTIHFPSQKGENFMEGTKEAVLFALVRSNNYDEIIFDPYRGVEAPNIVSIPHMYILFYSSYDPQKYQTEQKKTGEELYGFDKYTIRKINWSEDRSLEGKLFIGSPWSLPEKDLKESEILKKIYLTSGDLAFIVVSPELND